MSFARSRTLILEVVFKAAIKAGVRESLKSVVEGETISTGSTKIQKLAREIRENLSKTGFLTLH